MYASRQYKEVSIRYALHHSFSNVSDHTFKIPSPRTFTRSTSKLRNSKSGPCEVNLASYQGARERRAKDALDKRMKSCIFSPFYATCVTKVPFSLPLDVVKITETLHTVVL